MSLLLRMPQQLSDASMITIYAAVAVQRALKQLYQTDTQIKWVNDIFYQGKKLCGILCEAISDFESGRLEAIIVGIGLNTSTMTFPEELKDIAVSLSTHPVNRNKLIACIVNELLALQKEEHSSVLAQYRDASVVLHQQISWMQNGKQLSGYVKDINNAGNLIVESEDTTHILSSGEVSIEAVAA